MTVRVFIVDTDDVVEIQWLNARSGVKQAVRITYLAPIEYCKGCKKPQDRCVCKGVTGGE